MAARRNPTYYPGDLRADLVTAAAELIAERGADSVSLREVARRVGVSHAAPAHHFTDRTGLLTAVATQGFTRLRDEVARARKGKPDARGIVAAGVAYVAYGSANWTVFELMFRSALLRADAAYVDAGLAARGELEQAVTDAQRTGWAPGRPPDELVLTCWALAHGLAGLAAAGAIPAESTSVEAVVRSTVTALGG